MNHNHLCNGSTWGIHFVVYPVIWQLTLEPAVVENSDQVSGVWAPFGLAALNKQEESVLNFDHWLTEYGQTFVCVRPTSGE